MSNIPKYKYFVFRNMLKDLFMSIISSLNTSTSGSRLRPLSDKQPWIGRRVIISSQIIISLPNVTGIKSQFLIVDDAAERMWLYVT